MDEQERKQIDEGTARAPAEVQERAEPERDGPGSAPRHSIRERFERRAHLLSTRTSECFQSVDNVTGAAVQLWLLRFPLSPHSEDAHRFVRRLRRISQLELSVPGFLQCGVDSAGSAYLVTEPVDGGRLIDQKDAALDELQDRFRQVVVILARLHAEGLYLGDLCEDTFVLDTRGRAVLSGVLGTFDAGARQTAMLPPPETYHYLAPEQRSGCGPDIVSDVYALGVYGYRLLTGRYLLADHIVAGSTENPVMTAPAPSLLRTDLPRWYDDVLGRCLEVAPEHRYRDAGEILDALNEAAESGDAAIGSGNWSRRTTLVHVAERERPAEPPPVETPRVPAPRVRTEIAEVDGGDEPGQKWRGPSLFVVVWAGAVALGAAAAALIFFSVDIWSPSPESGPAVKGTPSARSEPAGRGPQDAVLQQSEYAPADLKPFIAKLSQEKVSPAERQEALLRIAESDDPIAYGVLIAAAKSHIDFPLRETAQRLLVERIKKFELKRSAAVVERWFKQEIQAKRDPGQSPAYGLLLTACNPGRGFDSRRTALLQAFAADRVVTLQLTATLALDESEEKSVPILRKLLAAELGEQEVGTKGIGALVFSHPALSSLLDRDAQETIHRFSDADLRWVLLHAQSVGASLRESLVTEAVSRKMLTPYESVFLEVLLAAKGSSIPEPVEQGLIRAASGEIDEVQVDAFARWMSPFADRVLLAVCVAARDGSVAQDAFDILAGRSLRMQPAESLIKWIKARFWEQRKKAVKAIGILGLIERASPEDISYAFDLLMPYSGAGMFRLMVNSGNVILVREAIERLGAITSTNDIMPLLGHEDKNVRIAAISALKGRNELLVLQSILRAYEREKDEEVREVYHKYHWVTRERAGRIPR